MHILVKEQLTMFSPKAIFSARAKFLTVTLGIILCLHDATAQTPALLKRRDSLTNLLKTQTDTARGFTLLRLSDNYLRLNDGHNEPAIKYSAEAYQIFAKARNGFGMTWAKFEEGTAYMSLRKFPQALSALNIAKDIPISDTIKRKNELLGTIWNQIANIDDEQGNTTQSTDILLKKVLPLFEAAKDERNIAFTSASLATSFLNFKQYEKAIYYYKKELIDYKGPKIESYFAIDYSRLAFCLTEIKQLKEAKPYLDSALKILQAYPRSYPWLKYYYCNANWYQKQGLHVQALANYNQALAVAKQINNQYDVVNILFGKYDVLYTQKNYAAAKSVAYDIYNLNRQLKDTIKLDRVGIYKTLYEIEKVSGNNTIALNWMERYAALTDSINKTDEKLRFNGLEEKYQAAKKEKDILKLQNQAKEQQLSINKNRLLLVLLLGALIISALLLLTYFIIAKNRKRASLQKELLHQQQLKQKENEQQLLVFNAMLNGQEKERTRLSRDLHDGLGGTLAGIKLHLQSQANQTQQPGLQPIIEQMSDAVKELRRIAHNTMPENLLRFGLEAAVSDLCENLQTPATSINFYATNLSATLSQQEQLTIYRIIQELLGNALKYANASEILVQCIQSENHFSITVEDNGNGFDVDTTMDKSGMGLFNVQNRTRYLQGTMDIQSSKEVGTTVNIDLKVNNG
jgi:two-component system NarL family sensor kinase